MDSQKVFKALDRLVRAMYEEDHGPGAPYTGDFDTEITDFVNALCDEKPPPPTSQASGHAELYQTLRRIFKAGVDGDSEAAARLIREVMELFVNTKGE